MDLDFSSCIVIKPLGEWVCKEEVSEQNDWKHSTEFEGLCHPSPTSCHTKREGLEASVNVMDVKDKTKIFDVGACQCECNSLLMVPTLHSETKCVKSETCNFEIDGLTAKEDKSQIPHDDTSQCGSNLLPKVPAIHSETMCIKRENCNLDIETLTAKEPCQFPMPIKYSASKSQVTLFVPALLAQDQAYIKHLLSSKVRVSRLTSLEIESGVVSYRGDSTAFHKTSPTIKNCRILSSAVCFALLRWNNVFFSTSNCAEFSEQQL